MATQIPIAQKCAYCGRTVQPLHELVELADLALAALDNRRLTLPDVVPQSMRAISRDLRCLAGACGGAR